MKADAEIVDVSLVSDAIGKQKLQLEQRGEKMGRAKERICAGQHWVQDKSPFLRVPPKDCLISWTVSRISRITVFIL